MKKLYIPFFYFAVSLLLLLPAAQVQAQCPFGYLPGATAYDTIVKTPSGIASLQIKLPKADPSVGMITCLRICVSITGVVDSAHIENNQSSAATAEIRYNRTDKISGPGLSSPIYSNVTHLYGPYNLAATNGVPFSGPDFVSVSKDTVLNAVTSCQTISNMDSLYQFYGHDSLTYQYDIDADVRIVSSSGNLSTYLATSALVRIRFEYCTCPGLILPINVRNFNAIKSAANTATLNWQGLDDASNSMAYRYITEVSTDGTHFETFGQLQGNPNSNSSYTINYLNRKQENGTFYFRLKQVFANGYTQISEIKKVVLEGSEAPAFKVFPNPSNGIIGIKFANNQNGKTQLQIFNLQGQKLVEKEIEAHGSYYQQAVNLSSGNYWLRLTDVSTQLSTVSQLFIK